MKSFVKLIATGLIGTIALTGSASTIYFMVNNGSNDNNHTSLLPGGTELTDEQEAVDKIKNNLFNYLSGSNLKFNDLLLNVEGLGATKSEALQVNYKGAMDYKVFMSTHKNNITSDDLAAKFNGNINIKYLDNTTNAKYTTKLDETIGFQSQGTGKLFLDWKPSDQEGVEATKYSISGKVIDDVLDFLPTIQTMTGVDLSSVRNYYSLIKNIDITSLLSTGLNLVGSLSQTSDLDQTPIDGIYSFNIVVPASLLKDAGINQDLHIVFKCDENGLLTAVELYEIDINGIKIYLSSDILMDISDSGYVSDVDEDSYNNNLDCTTNALTTVASLIDEKKFDTNLAFSLKEDVNGINVTTRTFDGYFKGDLSSAKAINDGAIYDIGLVQNETFNSSVSVRYDNHNTYFKVGSNLAKGFISDSTIDDLTKNITSTMFKDDSVSADAALNMVSTILGDSPIYEIMEGNWGAYKKFIRNLTINDEVMTLTINAKAFGSKLVDQDFTINIDLKGGKLNSLSIKDLPVTQKTKTDGKVYISSIDFSVNLVDFGTHVSDVIEHYGVFSEYANFEIANPLYNTIYKIVDSKTVGANYSISYTKENESKEFFTIDGTIDGDVNSMESIDLSTLNTVENAVSAIKGKNLGLYNITAGGSINGIEHNLSATYQEESLYLDYWGANKEITESKMSLTQGKFFDIFTLVYGMIGGSASKEVSMSFDSMTSTLDNLIDVTNGQIWDILKGDTMSNLDKYIEVKSDGSNKNLVNVAIYTTLFGGNYGLINLVLDSANELLSIHANYITEGYGTIDFSFNFRDYNNPTIASDDIAINYKVMDGTIDAIIKLISGTALSSLEVSGSLAGPRR
jgi:hypothetical protein